MSDPRFSIIPAGAVLDRRLEPRDLQVLCLFGKHTDRKGWCRRSQVAMASEIGCARSTVQASIDRLIGAGWLQKRPASDLHTPGVRDSAHEYRVVLDTSDDTQDVVGTPADQSAPPAAPISAPPADLGIGTYVNGSTSNEKKEASSTFKGKEAGIVSTLLLDRHASSDAALFDACAELMAVPEYLQRFKFPIAIVEAARERLAAEKVSARRAA